MPNLVQYFDSSSKNSEASRVEEEEDDDPFKVDYDN